MSQRSVSPPSRSRLAGGFGKICRGALVALLLLGITVIFGSWMILRSSLPQLEGQSSVAGLSAEVQIDRDAQGVPTVRAANELDAMRALGFLHAQERFFQMDLIRRKSAGTLAALLGPAALGADREVRRHGFRSLAHRVWRQLNDDERARLASYTAGVNAGLQSLAGKPWEYHLLRGSPVPWTEEDCLLVSYTMWLDLQDEQGRFERTVQAVQAVMGEKGRRTFAPIGDAYDAPLDGSMPAPAALPPALGFVAVDRPPHVPTEPVTGSNAFAVAGRHTANGSALLASDMHLGLAVPNVWYRAVLQYPDHGGRTRRIVGVTLPGVPSVSSGSNGRIAWGFTNSYIDTVDVVPLQVEADGRRYRTEAGWVPFEERREVIEIKGGKDVVEEFLWTQWGPVVEGPEQGRATAIRWTAYDPAAFNLAIMGLLEADTVPEALAVAHRAGMANQNLLLADSSGRIAWTIAGQVPARSPDFDGLRAGDWSTGESQWTGWLANADVPVIVDPPEGLLWSANNRHVGGEMLRRLGDNGYDHGYRAGTIRDAMRILIARQRPVVPADLLAIQLDDTLRHFEPWRDLLVAVLQDARDPIQTEVRTLAGAWTGRADPASAGYRLVRLFREEVRARVLAPYLGPLRRAYGRLNPDKLHHEEMVLALLKERPSDRLDPKFATWDALLAEAAAAVAETASRDGRRPRDFTWGEANRLDMRHPLTRGLPRPLTRFLDMPDSPLPGDEDSPRNQKPRHGASERLVVSPGHEEEGLFQMPGGQSGHPLSPYYRAGHEAWVRGDPSPLMPGPTRHGLRLIPR